MTAAPRTLPEQGRLLGVDLGDVRIGLAVCDDRQTVATPHATVEVADVLGDRLSEDGRGAADTTEDELRRLADRLAEEADAVGAVGYVVGYPRRLDGREGAAGQRARRLADILGENRPADLWDERMTSVEADRVLLAQGAGRGERRRATDRVAATLILQGYLESRTA